MTRAWAGDSLKGRAWRFVSSPAGVTTALVLTLAALSLGAWHFLASPVGLTVASILVLVALSVGTRCLPRLHFQPFGGGDTDDGSGRPGLLRALVRAELHRLATEDARLPGDRPLRLDHAGPYEDHYSLEAVGEGLSPVYKLLSAVTGQLISALPSRARLVNGFLVPSATVILSIETVRGEVERMATIRQDDLGFPLPVAGPGKGDGVEELVQLAMPAAAWILLTRYDDASLGGTHDWASYLAFAAGCAWQAQGDLVKAEERYRAACADKSNTAAAVNLAGIERLNEKRAVAQGGSTASPAAIPVSVQRLARLTDDPHIDEDNPQWYRGRYLLSSALRDDFDDLPGVATATSGQADRARELAAELAAQMLTGQAAAGARAPGSIPAEFYATGQAAALTLVARQAVPQAASLQDVTAEQEQAQVYSDADIPAVLTRLANRPAASELSAGVAEALVNYVRRTLQLDDQAYYNLARFHNARAKIYSDAISRWETLLSQQPPYWQTQVSEEVRLWQDVLEGRYRAEVERARAYQGQVSDTTSDPVLAGLTREIPGLDPATVEARARHPRPDGPPGQRLAPAGPPDLRDWPVKEERSPRDPENGNRRTADEPAPLNRDEYGLNRALNRRGQPGSTAGLPSSGLESARPGQSPAPASPRRGWRRLIPWARPEAGSGPPPAA